MKDEDRYRLYFGPYETPRIRRGGRIFDAIHGTVIANRYSDGRITWPCLKRGNSNWLVLCGDLLKAVRLESCSAVAYWWGISRSVVTRWRNALEVARPTHGDRLLRAAWAKELAARRVWVNGQRASADPVFRTRLARKKRKMGIPAPKASRRWTPDEEALLGTMFDAKLGRKFGCSRMVVARRRLMFGIPPFRKTVLHEERVAVSPRKVLAMRLALKVSQQTIARRSGIRCYGNLESGVQKNTTKQTAERLAAFFGCRPQDILLKRTPVVKIVRDDSLLGTMPDSTLAKKWKMSFHVVRKRRMKLGIPTYQERIRPHIPKELLGTMSDDALAEKLKISKWLIAFYRRKYEIPGFMHGSVFMISRGRLKAIRRRLGLTQKEMAEYVGLEYKYYNSLERIRSKHVAHKTVDRIAAVLNCRVEDFTRLWTKDSRPKKDQPVDTVAGKPSAQVAGPPLLSVSETPLISATPENLPTNPLPQAPAVTQDNPPAVKDGRSENSASLYICNPPANPASGSKPAIPAILPPIQSSPVPANLSPPVT